MVEQMLQGAGSPTSGVGLGREHSAQPQQVQGVDVTLLTWSCLPLLPGWWRRQQKWLCPMPRLPSVPMPGGWVPSQRCSRAVISSPSQTSPQLCRGEGLGPDPTGWEGLGHGVLGLALLQPRSHTSLSPGLAASSLSLWSEGWRVAGASTRPSGSWCPQGPSGPAPGCTYRS